MTGIDRSDRGKSRVVDAATAERIVAERRTYPRRPATVLYETMAAEKRLDVSKVSMSTFYRCLKHAPVVEVPAMDGDRQLRFAYDRVNELWQGDVMYGPYVKDGRVKRQTYLIDFIDDASRLVVYGRFYWSQRYEELRDAFKEGVLRRGRPSRVFVDNGKIFHTQQFETVCATLGTTLIHSEPYVPNTRGKVERIHRTIRDRFLSVLDPTTLTGLDDLNTRFAQWLDTDYQRKVHSSTGRSPLEYFLSQADSVRLVEDRRTDDNPSG